MKRLCALLLLIFQVAAVAVERRSSEPYISGDTFRKNADHIFDKDNLEFDPKAVKKGDVVFLGMYEPWVPAKFFMEIHPHIAHPYILLSHNGDTPAPGKHREYLDDPKIFHWFGQNCDIKPHHKFTPVPIGLENAHWGREYDKRLRILSRCRALHANKKHLLLMNFNIANNEKERRPPYEMFKEKSFCFSPPTKDLREYLRILCLSQFVLSPLGHGLDCHRTWEALYLGVIPVVKTSTLDPLYDGLPVLIVKDWSEINANWLKEKYSEMKNLKWNAEKLWIQYWLRLIFEKQFKCCQEIS